MSKNMKLVIILGFAIGLPYKFAAGGEHGNDATKLIPNASEVLSATVVLTPSEVRRRTALREEDLLALGCNFSANKQKITSLVKIISDNVQRDHGQVRNFYLQNAVYLHLRNGKMTRFTFGGEGDRDKQINGAVDYSGSGSRAFFSAEYSLLIELRKWLQDGQIEKKDGEWCLKNK